MSVRNVKIKADGVAGNDTTPLKVREKSLELVTFLQGTVQQTSPLSKLRGQENILRVIWEIVCAEWIDLHIDRFPLVDSIPNLLPWSNDYPSDRQNHSGCPVAVIAHSVSFPVLSSIPLGTFQNQESDALYVNMMPFKLLDENTLPPHCRPYWPIIQQCTRIMSFHSHSSRVYPIGYLTIDERPVTSGSSQRRPGLHVESPGVMPLIQSNVNWSERNFEYAIKRANGVFVPGAEHHWGGGLMMRNERVDGGIFMASNIADTTAVWSCRINDEDGDFIGAHGDIERFRDLLGPCARTLNAGELIWMTDRTPHESLPIPASAGSKRRQYFRLVVGQVSAWFADHSTPNPLGTVPPPEVRIIQGNKFTLYPTPTRSWHCGTPEQISAARDWVQVQQKLYEFGLGHMSERVFRYGLTSIADILLVHELQGGNVKGIQVDWNGEFSQTHDMELFADRGSYYYDRKQFAKLIISLK